MYDKIIIDITQIGEVEIRILSWDNYPAKLLITKLVTNPLF